MLVLSGQIPQNSNLKITNPATENRDRAFSTYAKFF